jgi:penicillin-binding protein 1A
LRIAGLAAILALGLATAGLAVGLYQIYALPLPKGFEDPRGVALDLAFPDGAVFAARGVARGRPVELAEVPQHLVEAVLAMEDRRFFEHSGLDLRGVVRAAFANLEAGDSVQGGSTITQQLAKNLFLSPERAVARKIQEVILAAWLERRLTKEEILARYLDTVYLGAGAYGLDAASRRYFGKRVGELSLAESAILAGLIQAPSRFAPTGSLEQAHERARIVLDAMVEAGAISTLQAEEARAHPAELARPPVEQLAFGYVADFAAAEARAMLGDVTGDFVVATTIDRRLQLLARRTIEAWLAREGDALAADQAALVALAPSGAVLAMVGGRDYRESQFNRAVQARRQPGSLFKLFVYLAALRAGLSPDSPIEDAPLEIDGWRPANYADRYLGATDLRTAFAQSLNSAAVRLQEQVGREQVIAVARQMGITSPLPPHPSLALGGMEASLLELTTAYAAVRAGAPRIEPYVVRAVQAQGGVAFRQRRAPPSNRDWLGQPMVELLGEAVRSGTGRAAALDVPVFGKTGTTQDHRDAWFIGFTEDLVVGVWVGNDENTPMTGVTGSGLPAKIWRSFVAQALRPPGEPDPVAQASRTMRAAVMGIPDVVDTATLRIAGGTVRLDGVAGVGGSHARDMAAYIGDREIACRLTAHDRYRCEADGWDLSEVVLRNGAGRATLDAAPELVEAQRKAREENLGIWAAPVLIRGH